LIPGSLLPVQACHTECAGSAPQRFGSSSLYIFICQALRL
jgi:hypothetical protein